MIDVAFPGSKNLNNKEKRGWKYVVHMSYDKHTKKIFSRKKEILSFRKDILGGEYKGRIVHNTKRYREVKPEALTKLKKIYGEHAFFATELYFDVYLMIWQRLADGRIKPPEEDIRKSLVRKIKRTKNSITEEDENFILNC